MLFKGISLGLLVLAITFFVLWLVGKRERSKLIGNHATELTKLSSQADLKLTELEEEKELVRTLKKENVELQADLDDSRINADHYEKKYANLSTRKASGDHRQAVTPSNDNIKREHAEDRTRWEQERDQLKSSLFDKNRKLDDKDRELEKKNRQLEESSGEAKRVQADLEKERAEHQQASGEVATLNESLRAKENELTGLQETVQKKDHELTAARERLTAVAGKPVIPTQALPACFLANGPLCDWGERIFRETEVNPDKLVIRELFSLILSLKVAADSGNQDNLLGCLREVSKPMYRLLKEEGMDENESYQVAKLWADSLNDDIGKQFNVGIKVPQHGEPLSRKWMNITSGRGQSVAGILSWAIIRDDVAVRKADITT